MNLGIPIVNKRISITPISLVGGNVCKTPDDFVELAKVLDAAAKKVESTSQVDILHQ